MLNLQFKSEHLKPATVFLPTDFIATDTWFWIDRLAHLLKQGEYLKISRSQNALYHNCLINKLEEIQDSYQNRLEKSIEILKTLRDEEIEEILSELSLRWNVKSMPQGRAFIS